MRELSTRPTPGWLHVVGFLRWSLPLLLAVILISLVSCGDGVEGVEQKTPVKINSVQKHPGVDGEPTVGQGNSDSLDPVVGTKAPDPAPSEPHPPASQESTIEAQGLPDLSLTEDPAFQRRAKLGHLVAKKRCILCHKVDGRGAVLQPPLIQVSVRRLERMQSFSDHLETMRQDDPNRYEAKKELFLAIEDEANQLRKMSLWLHGYLKQPTFDNALAKMPLQVLKPEEIDQLVSYVIQLSIDGVRKGVKPPE